MDVNTKLAISLGGYQSRLTAKVSLVLVLHDYQAYSLLVMDNYQIIYYLQIKCFVSVCTLKLNDSRLLFVDISDLEQSTFLSHGNQLMNWCF